MSRRLGLMQQRSQVVTVLVAAMMVSGLGAAPAYAGEEPVICQPPVVMEEICGAEQGVFGAAAEMTVDHGTAGSGNQDFVFPIAAGAGMEVADGLPRLDVCDVAEMPFQWRTEPNATARSMEHQVTASFSAGSCAHVERLELELTVVDHGVKPFSFSWPATARAAADNPGATAVATVEHSVPILTPATDYHGLGSHVSIMASGKIVFTQGHLPAEQHWCGRVEYVYGTPAHVHSPSDCSYTADVAP